MVLTWIVRVENAENAEHQTKEEDQQSVESDELLQPVQDTGHHFHDWTKRVEYSHRVERIPHINENDDNHR